MIRAPPGRQPRHRQLRNSHALSLCRKQHHTFVPASGHMVGHIETETVPHNRVKKRRGYAARAAYYHARKISALLVRVLARRVSGLAGAPGLAGAAASAGLILWHTADTHNAVLSIQKVFFEKPQAGSPACPARQNLISHVCGRTCGITGPATARYTVRQSWGAAAVPPRTETGAPRMVADYAPQSPACADQPGPLGKCA